MPLKRAYKHLRPAWNDQLKLAHSKSKNLYREWVAAGRPREESHPIKVAYKQAKSTFRASLRQHQRELRDARLLELDASDPSRLFAHIRRLNGVNLSPSRLLVVDGVSYEGAQIIEAWAIYFQDLSTPKDLGYDNVFALEVLEQYESLCSLSLADFVDFSDDEVLEAIQSLLSLADFVDFSDDEVLEAIQFYLTWPSWLETQLNLSTFYLVVRVLSPF